MAFPPSQFGNKKIAFFQTFQPLSVKYLEQVLYLPAQELMLSIISSYSSHLVVGSKLTFQFSALPCKR